MALSKVGGSPFVKDATDFGPWPTATFTPSGNWALDDILLIVIGVSGALNFITLADDQSLAWHGSHTAGTGLYPDGDASGFRWHSFWAHIPAALAGTSTPVVMQATFDSGAASRMMYLPGIAVRGAKKVRKRHCPVSTSDTDDYATATGNDPTFKALPAHAPGNNDGTAGAVELILAASNSSATVGDIDISGATNLDGGAGLGGLFVDWDGGIDTWIAFGYNLLEPGADDTETAATGTIDGYGAVNKTIKMARFMYILDVNVAPTIVIDSAVDEDAGGDNLDVQLTIDSISDEYGISPSDSSYPYPLSYNIEWGDGDETEVFISNTGYDLNSGWETAGEHTYASPGFYTITTTITDEDGLTGTDTIDVEVVGPAPREFNRQAYTLRKFEGTSLPYDVSSIDIMGGWDG